MKTILALTASLILQAHSHNVDRHRCQYYDNPQFVALYDNTNRGFKPSEAVGYCLANRNGHGEEPQNLDLYGYFPGQDVERRPEDLMKSFNMGYLNVEEPLESIGDLVALNSDEIGVFEMPKKEDPTKLWKADEMSSLTGPKLLPDVVLVTENPNDPKPSNAASSKDVLDDQEIKLGRTLVEDVPYISDPMPVEKSLRQEVADMGNVEFGEKYLEEAPDVFTPPHSILLDKVVRRDEKVPNFMEQLEELKQETIKGEDGDVGETELEKDFGELTSLPESSTLPPTVTESVPLTTTTTSKSMVENTIEKGIGIIEENIDVTDPPKEVTSSKKKSKKSKRRNKTKNTVRSEPSENGEAQELKTASRFSDSNDTLLDGLLTVL